MPAGTSPSYHPPLSHAIYIININQPTQRPSRSPPRNLKTSFAGRGTGRMNPEKFPLEDKTPRSACGSVDGQFLQHDESVVTRCEGTCFSDYTLRPIGNFTLLPYASITRSIYIYTIRDQLPVGWDRSAERRKIPHRGQNASLTAWIS